MNKYIIGGLIFVAGVVVGATAHHFYAKKRLGEMQEVNDKLTAELVEEIRKEKPEISREENSREIDEKPVDVDVVSEIIQKHSYGIVDKPLSNVVPIPAEKPLANYNNTPYVIDEREFVENDSGYPQASLYFYLEDATLTMEDDNVVVYNRPVPVVGEEALDMLSTGDCPVIYVRNTRERIEYEIVALPNEFAIVHADELDNMTVQYGENPDEGGVK